MKTDMTGNIIHFRKVKSILTRILRVLKNFQGGVDGELQRGAVFYTSILTFNNILQVGPFILVS